MRSKKIILFFLLLSTAFVIPLIEADPGWLTGWNYRKSITVIGSVDGAQTDYQRGFFVYKGIGVDGSLTIGHTTFGKVYTSAQDNFGDIRFTKADGTTELDYWIEYFASADYGIFWVEIDAIPESPSTLEIYVYYDTEGATSTTSNISATWTDSLDWTSDLTGDFTKYDSTALDREVTWLTSTDAEYPCRIITKRAITDVWDQDAYGVMTRINTDKIADDVRDSATDLSSYISSDTGHGADGTHGAYWVGALLLTDSDVETITLDQWLVNDLVIVEDTSASNDFHVEGRGALKCQEFVADAPDSMNYWGYSVSGTGGPLAVQVFSYDAVNDVIEWGGRRSGGGEHYEKSPWMVIGKYTANEPTWGDWGPEEEPPLIETPAFLFGAGFNASNPFVNLRWASNLTDISFFEIQNSTDKITWEYLGQSANNSYDDFQVVNGTERYYRVRACNFTEPVWNNSTWADIDFEKVYYLVGGGAPGPGPAAGLFPGLAIGIAILIIAYAYSETRR